VTMQVPESVATALSRFDASEPVGELDVSEALRSVAKDLDRSDQSLRDGWFAEISAFRFSPSRCGDRSIWGTCYGPRRTTTNQSGEKGYFPDLKEIDAEIIAHWEARSAADTHPILKARYADLVWDLKRAVTGERPDPKFARLAVSAYVEAVERRLYRHEVNAVRYVERSLDIAVPLNDAGLLKRVVDTTFLLHGSIRDPRKPGHCFFLFDLLCERHRKKASLDQAVVRRIVDDLEDLLRTWSDKTRSCFNPHSAQDAAKRLIGEYRREGDEEQVKRVARIAGHAMEESAAMGDALLGTMLLQDIHRFYQETGLRTEADRVFAEASRRGRGIEGCMARFSTTFEVDKGTVDRAVAELTSGDLSEVINRIVGSFLPNSRESSVSGSPQSSSSPSKPLPSGPQASHRAPPTPPSPPERSRFRCVSHRAQVAREAGGLLEPGF